MTGEARLNERPVVPTLTPAARWLNTPISASCAFRSVKAIDAAEDDGDGGETLSVLGGDVFVHFLGVFGCLTILYATIVPN